MILDKLENINFYSFASPNFKRGVEFALTLIDKPVGRYEDGEIFALVQEGNTRSFSEAKFESHKKYIDVQIVLKGADIFVWKSIDELENPTEYNDEKDVIHYKDTEGMNLKLTDNTFIVFYPKDGHKACCHDDNPTTYRKIVLKLPVQ